MKPVLLLWVLCFTAALAASAPTARDGDDVGGDDTPGDDDTPDDFVDAHVLD